MKTLIKVTVVLAGILSAALPATRGADLASSPTTPPPAQAPGRHGGLERLMFRRRVARQLGLTTDQIAQLKGVRANAAASVKAIRADTSLTPDQRRERVRQTIDSAREQMRALLTPDQQAKLQEIREHGRNGGDN